MITFLGEKMDSYFKEVYPLDSSVTRTRMSAFPPGTKVTFSVVPTGQLDNQDQESVSNSTSENGDDDNNDDADMASTDGGKYLFVCNNSGESSGLLQQHKTIFFSVRTSGNEGSLFRQSFLS